MGYNNTPKGKEMLRNVATYISTFIYRLAWGTDQQALYSCWRNVQPSVRCLNELETDYEYNDEGIIWQNSSVNKIEHLNGRDGGRPKYFEKWSKYNK